MPLRYDAVLFDLLTALLDSWTLWNRVAGDAASGHRWRAEYLRITYKTGHYRCYEELVAEAAEGVGLPRRLAGDLADRYGEIEPWSETGAVLHEINRNGMPVGVVTNCSEALGQVAAARLGIPLKTMVTAERAGFYKPDPQPYRLALAEVGVEATRCLFVAGSAYDLWGTAQVGLPTWWHDRIGMTLPDQTPLPIARHRNLTPLITELFG